MCIGYVFFRLASPSRQNLNSLHSRNALRKVVNGAYNATVSCTFDSK